MAATGRRRKGGALLLAVLSLAAAGGARGQRRAPVKCPVLPAGCGNETTIQSCDVFTPARTVDCDGVCRSYMQAGSTAGAAPAVARAWCDDDASSSHCGGRNHSLEAVTWDDEETGMKLAGLRTCCKGDDCVERHAALREIDFQPDCLSPKARACVAPLMDAFKCSLDVGSMAMQFTDLGAKNLGAEYFWKLGLDVYDPCASFRLFGGDLGCLSQACDQCKRTTGGQCAMADLPAPGCLRHMIGDGYCHGVCMNGDSGMDAGDCHALVQSLKRYSVYKFTEVEYDGKRYQSQLEALKLVSELVTEDPEKVMATLPAEVKPFAEEIQIWLKNHMQRNGTNYPSWNMATIIVLFADENSDGVLSEEEALSFFSALTPESFQALATLDHGKGTSISVADVAQTLATLHAWIGIEHPAFPTALSPQDVETTLFQLLDLDADSRLSPIELSVLGIGSELVNVLVEKVIEMAPMGGFEASDDVSFKDWSRMLKEPLADCSQIVYVDGSGDLDINAVWLPKGHCDILILPRTKIPAPFNISGAPPQCGPGGGGGYSVRAEPNRKSKSSAKKLRHSRSLKTSRVARLMRHAHKGKTAVSSVKRRGPFSVPAAPGSARSFSRSARRMPERRVAHKSTKSSTQVTALLQKSYKKGTQRHKKSVHRNIVPSSLPFFGRERMAELRYARGMKCVHASAKARPLASVSDSRVDRATVASIESARRSSTRTSSSTRATINKQHRTPPLGGDRASLRREHGMTSADQDRNQHKNDKNSVRPRTFKPLCVCCVSASGCVFRICLVVSFAYVPERVSRARNLSLSLSVSCSTIWLTLLPRTPSLPVSFSPSLPLSLRLSMSPFLPFPRSLPPVMFMAELGFRSCYLRRAGRQIRTGWW